MVISGMDVLRLNFEICSYFWEAEFGISITELADRKLFKQSWMTRNNLFLQKLLYDFLVQVK